MITQLIQFGRLKPAEKKFFIKSCWLMIFFRIALKRRPFQQIMAETKVMTGKITTGKSQEIRLHRAARLAKTAGSIIPFSTCLSRALAGYVLLAEQGFETTLHIGVTRDDSYGFEAHAWLTHNNSIILGNLPDLDKYQELPLQ
ncbi:MAG: hypothetical protein CR981_04165 [Proteobacteria bacterium]|nr:MAG: hypothetical protein CR981_04165 [Pseudomonadota bacterium]PIE65411.1 MAG: hypothetical protein CSA26_03565 [Desulfobacterales bacterium]